jgi:hypothetical protein
LLAQEPQNIELLVVVFGAPPDAGFADLAEPFRRDNVVRILLCRYRE